jgi:hypothetical protein
MDGESPRPRYGDQNGASPGSGTGVHRNTLTSRSQSPRVQAFLRQIVRVLTSAQEVSGDESVAAAWLLDEPLPVFSNQTAFTLIDVVAYLGRTGTERSSDPQVVRIGGQHPSGHGLSVRIA